jgi:hypothetical protein
MQTMLVPVAILALTFAPASAWAQSQPQAISQPNTTPATASSLANANPNQVICRPAIKLGSLIPTQDCRTRQQWDTERFRNQQELNQVQMRGLDTQPH